MPRQRKPGHIEQHLSGILDRTKDHALAQEATRDEINRFLYGFLQDEGMRPHFLDSPFLPPFFTSDAPSSSNHTGKSRWKLHEEQKQRDKSASDDFRCLRIFSKGESVYCCRECGYDEQCILCADCFDPAQHEGHDVIFTIQGNGPLACVCGDSGTILPSCTASCKKHGPLAGPSDPTIRDANNIQLLPEIVRSLRTRDQLSPFDRLYQIVIDLIYFCQMVWEVSQPVMSAPQSPETMWSIFAMNEEQDTITDSKIAQGPWAVLLWNDERHTYDQVITQLRRAIPSMTKIQALEAATRVDCYGREVVYIGTDRKEIYKICKILGAIDLAVDVRAAYDTFLEGCTGLVVDFLIDIAQCTIAGNPTAARQVIIKTLLDPSNPPTDKAPNVEFNLELDNRLWKSLRLSLRELYRRCLAIGGNSRLEFAYNFMVCYPRLVDCYMFNDREPEYSALQMSAQLFSLPSVARILAHRNTNNNALTMLIYVLYAFFTEQYERKPSHLPKSLRFPPDLTKTEIHPDGANFKHKRYTFIFSDLIRMLDTDPVKHMVVEAPFFFSKFASFVSLFSGMNSTRREVGQHVEYEQETWIAAFNLSMQLGKASRAFGAPFFDKAPRAVYEAVASVVPHCLPSLQSRVWHQVKFGGTQAIVLDYEVATKVISFHHPASWLLSEICKGMRMPTGESSFGGWLQQITKIPENVALLLAEGSLQVCALLAQIRAGLWVRNGFSIRAQQLHYRESALREYAYEQDLFLLQFLLAVGHSSRQRDDMLLAIIDRFDLVQWLDTHEYGGFQHSHYEPQAAYTIAEELLALLITLLSEPLVVEEWTEEQWVERDLCQALALGSASASELNKRMLERTAHSKFCDRILHKVATFRAPQGPFDHGVFYLRPEFYARANPYYFRYNRNQRDECAKAVREKSDDNDTYIPPATMDLTKRPILSSLRRVYNSRVLLTLLGKLLRRYSKDASGLASEAFLDLTLHLLVICLINADGPTTLAEEYGNIHQLLLCVGVTPLAETARPKLDWCLKRMESIVPAQTQKTLLNPPAAESVNASPIKAPASRDERKAAAKARQEAILAQFKDVSQKFFEEHDDDGEELDFEDDALGSHPGDLGSENAMDVDKPRRKRKVMGSCIVCQEDLDEDRAFGALSMIQTSRLLKTENHRFGRVMYDGDGNKVPAGLELGHGQETPQYNTLPGLYTSTCGHMMHVGCFETYCWSVDNRHLHHPTRNHPENLSRREFICPLCKSLHNVLMSVSCADDDLVPLPIHKDGALLRESPSKASEAFDVIEAWKKQTLKATQLLDEAALETMSFEALCLSEDLPPPISNSFAKALGGSVPHTDESYEMLARLHQVAWPLIEEGQSEQFADRSIEAHDRDLLFNFPMTTHLVGYTLGVWEVACRTEASAMSYGLLRSVPLDEKSDIILKGLLTFVKHTFDIQIGEGHKGNFFPLMDLRTACANSLGAELFNFLDKLTFWTFDLLGPMVAMAAIVPEQFFLASTHAYYAALVQAAASLLTYDSDVALETPSALNEEAIAVQEFLFKILGLLEDGRPDLAHLGHRVLRATAPFLHKLSIIASVLRKTGDGGPSTELLGYEQLLSQLCIIPPSFMVQNPENDIFKAFLPLRDFRIGRNPKRTNIKGRTIGLPKLGLYKLFQLPDRLDQIVQTAAHTKCRRCDTIPTDPAICLICGTLVCNQSFCCMSKEEEEPLHGECNTHMWSCGGSVGIYFLIKRCAIIYCYTSAGTFSNPPYLDPYGEVDLGHKRHTMQYLHGARFDELRKNWLEHNIPTIVARRLEASIDSGGWISL